MSLVKPRRGVNFLAHGVSRGNNSDEIMAAPEGRKKDALFPYVTCIVLDPVLFQKDYKFFLKSDLSMMRFLPPNILNHIRDIRLAHAECSITGLPTEQYASPGMFREPSAKS